MIIFGSSIVWHEWKKKRKKNKELRSLDCCNLEYHPGRPAFICEFKKKERHLKRNVIIRWRHAERKKLKREGARMEQDVHRKEGKKRVRHLKKKMSTGARGRERVKHMEWHEGWDDSQFCSDTSVESQTLTQSACHHRLLMDTQYWIHTPALHSDAVPHCRHLAFN